MSSFQQVSSSNFCPWSTVNAVIVKWKHLGATKAQPWNGRPHKLTERDRRVLKHVKIACPRLQHSLLSSKLPLEATSAQERFPHKPKIPMRNAKRRLEWCKARYHWTLEQRKHILWSDESRFTIWQTWRTNLVLEDARRRLPVRMHSANCKVWWRSNNSLRLFFMVRARPLSSVAFQCTLQHTMTL